MMALPGPHRRYSLLLSAALVGVSLLFARAGAPPRTSAAVAEQMREATAYFDSLIVVARAVSAPSDVSVTTAVSLGYLERLRLGMGSPFRLVDFALNDTRLSDAARHRLAWALLSRLRRGDAYVLDTAVTQGLSLRYDASAPSDAAHLALIERVIRTAADPRSGELTVRLAYTLAAGEHTISDRGSQLATQLAALVRDRALATSDLRTVLEESSADGLDPLQEIVRRRRERALDVERPAAEPLEPVLQTEAMRAVPGLLREIRSLESGEQALMLPTPRPTAGASVLGPAAATRVSSLGAEMPPEAAIAVTARSHRAALLAGDAPPAVEHARMRLAMQSLNAEMLVAGHELDLASGDTARGNIARVMLAAATASRAMAQQMPWFPGMAAPTVADLRVEYGIEGVAFDPEVRAAWRPYFLSLIGTSIADAQRVLAGLSVDGLRLFVGVGGLPDSVLALHDPKTRTIRLSVLSSSGAIAHELAHDLDWQAARRLFAGSGYSTDRAMREQRGALAASIRDLAAARVTNRSAPADERPAEVFARNVDWLVAMSLAREGRSNGDLSAVQDAAITGYTTVAPVGMIFGAARPLVDAVQEMTYLPEPVRTAFLEQWGDPRTVDPYLLVRYVLALNAPRRAPGLLPRLFAGDESRLHGARVRLCAEGALTWAPELRVRQMLLDLALESRALGIARIRARYYPAGARPGWANAIAGASPWSNELVSATVERIRSAIALQLDSDRTSDQLRFAAPSMFSAATDDPTCDR